MSILNRTLSIRLMLPALYLVCCSTILKAQQQTVTSLEDTLKKTGQLVLKAKTEKERTIANETFLELWKQALNLPNSIEYPFDSVANVSKIKSETDNFRIFTWMLAKDNGTYQYFGFLQIVPKKQKQAQVFFLNDKSADHKNAEMGLYGTKDWHGCIYYKMAENKHKRKNYYTLLGWDGNDKQTNKKVIEPVSFSKTGEPRFGNNVFKLEKGNPKRVIFEYNKQASMSLKYFPDNNRIIYDHLSPTEPNLTGQYQYYGPDFSYDALEFKKGKWVYIKDVTPRNDKEENVLPKSTKKIEDKTIYKPK